MKKRMLSMLLAIVIAAALLPTTALAAGEGYGNYTPTGFKVNNTTNILDDERLYITIKWKTTDPLGSWASMENINASYIEIEFKNNDVKHLGNWGTWANCEKTGNTIKMYFAESVLKNKDREAFVRLQINPGTTIKKIQLHNAVGGQRTYAGTVTIYSGLEATENRRCTPAYTIGSKTTSIECGEGNLLWATDNPNSMNSVGLKSATISEYTTGSKYLPSSPGVTVSIPIRVSALTDFETDAAYAYTGAAGKYEINKDVYARVKSIKYTGDKDYGESVYFSEKDGKLYLNVNESIYDKIGTAAQLKLPLVAEVEQTLTRDTVTSSEYTLELTRPYVTGDIQGQYIQGEWDYNSGRYKIFMTATLTPAPSYELPDTITVKAGDKVLAAGTDYDYDKSTGEVYIHAAAVTGKILITATGEKVAKPLEEDITKVLPGFNPETWYTANNSTLYTKPYWTVNTSKTEGGSGSITLDGEGGSLTKRLYFQDGLTIHLYYYDLTYKRDITAPVIGEISGLPAEGDYHTSAEIGFTASDATSGLKDVTVTCNDGKTVVFDNDSFTADRNGTYTIILTDNAGNETTQTITIENIHTHTYTYAANADNAAQIIESCACGHKETATLGYSTGSGSYAYTGSAITPVKVTYSNGWVGNKQAVIQYSNNTNAGTGAKGTVTIGGATATKTFVITKITPTLTAPTAQNNVIYGAKLSEVGLPSGWTWVNGNSVPTVQNSGYTAYYTPADTANYDWTQISGWNAAAGRVERTVSVTVNKADLTVTAEDKTATYGDAVPSYTVCYNGFKNGDDASRLGGTLAFGCDYAQFSGKGNYTIKASGYTSDNYNIRYVDGTLTVSAKPITVTIQNATSVYGNKIAELKAASEGIVNGDTDVYSLSTTATSTSDVGEYTITGRTNNSNYHITFKNGTNAYTITRRSLTVTIEVADKKYDGKKDAEITSAVLNNVVNGDNIVLTQGTATFATANVGNDISISFTAFAISGNKANNYTLVQPTGAKANITNGWNPAVNTEYIVAEPNGSGWLNNDFVITAKPGYKLSFTNTADGTWSDTLTGTAEGTDSRANFFVKNTADGTISEAAVAGYKLDKGKPAGKVSFDERTGWESFLHTISFGLFYKNEVTVKATATDSLSGVAKIEYIEASEKMSLEELQSSHAAWGKLPEDGKNVTLKDAKRFIYYIRITDNAGNVTYISTDGAEYDTTAPVISGIENGATYYTTQKVTVTEKNIASVKLNEEEATANITLDGNVDKTYTIVATDKAGNETTVTVTMKPIASISTPINSITEENVKSSDEETINDVIAQVDELLKDEDLTKAEKAALEEIKTDAGKLADKLKATADASKDLTDKVAALDKSTATSDDKQAVQELIDRADELLEGENLTDDEREALKEIKKGAEEVIAQIEEADKATTTDNTEKVKDTTPENVTPEDKTALEDAKTDLEEALKEHGSNMTEEERKAVQAEIDRIDDAIAVIEKVETVKEFIDKLPDTENVKLSDKKAISSAKDAYDKLSDYEKTLVDANKLNKLIKAFEKLSDDTNAPNTGNRTHVALWFVLMLSAAFGAVKLSIYSQKKKAK